MLPHEKLTRNFNKFAGCEVNVTETTHDTQYGKVKSVHVHGDDPTLTELRVAAEAAGLNLRLLLPGAGCTADYCDDRLNVHVAKEADGKYRIQKDFKIG